MINNKIVRLREAFYSLQKQGGEAEEGKRMLVIVMMIQEHTKAGEERNRGK